MPPTLPPSDPRSDADLILALRAGQAAALTVLVHRHLGIVWSIAYARLGQRDLADDLTQEVFLMAFLHLDDLLDPSRFAGWLSQITHHRVTDWLRDKQRSSKILPLVPLDSLPAAISAPDEPLLAAEQTDVLHQALFQLPEDQREIILLHFSQGLTQKEIATRLNVHPSTVTRQMQSALARLRQLMQDRFERSMQHLRPASHLAVRTTAVAAAVAFLSAPAKAALIATAGTSGTAALASSTLAAGSAAAGVATPLSYGVLTMASAKTVGIVSAIVLAALLTGAAIYMNLPTPSPSSQTAGAMPAASLASLPNVTPPASPAADNPRAWFQELGHDPDTLDSHSRIHAAILGDITPEGVIQSNLACLFNNADDKPLTTFSFQEITQARMLRIIDEEGRDLPFQIVSTPENQKKRLNPLTFSKETAPAPPANTSYNITFPTPIDPGHNILMGMVSEITGLVHPQPDGSMKFVMDIKQGPRLTIRRFARIRLPQGAQLLSADDAWTTAAAPDGRVELRLDKVYPPGSDLQHTFTYRLDSPRAWFKQFNMDPDTVDLSTQDYLVAIHTLTPQGEIHSRTATLWRHTGQAPLQTFSFNESNTGPRTVSFMDAQGRSLPFTTHPMQSNKTAYEISLSNAMPPGGNFLLGTLTQSNASTQWGPRLHPQVDGSTKLIWEIEQNDEAIHRAVKFILPPGARVLHSDRDFTRATGPNEPVSLVLIKTYPPHTKQRLAFTYR